MANIYTYIKENGDITFDQKAPTIIDILIFSQLTYLHFNKVVPENDVMVSLENAWINSKNNNKISKAIAHGNAVKMITSMYKTKRYKDIGLKNYVYKLNDVLQFGALTIDIGDENLYVCFEGTDDNIVGWKEDCEFSYIYPTGAQRMAGEYLNQIASNTNKKLIICGHSKGGNLALTGAMQMSFLKKFKIEKIYSFDGPGIKKKEFKSMNYKLVRKKLVNIIPNGSFIGILLEQENMNVIKSNGIGFFQHEPSTWQIEGDDFKYCKQDRLSKRLDESINRWLIRYDYEERKDIIDGLFSLFDIANIDSLYDIKENRLKSYYILAKSTKSLDDETREVLKDCFKLLMSEFGNNLINDGKKLINKTVKDIKNIVK